MQVAEGEKNKMVLVYFKTWLSAIARAALPMLVYQLSVRNDFMWQ